MNFGLQGKQALVTGSTAGIGLATAIGFAREGAHVIVNGRTQARVDAAVKSVQDAVDGATVRGVAADLSTVAGVDAVLAACPTLDVLINNLSIFEPKTFAQIPDEDWTRFFETNVLSGVRLCRAYLPKMLAAGWGRIVFVSSESAVQIPSEMIHYGVTKTAQVALARGLAELTSGTKVTVNSVLPGPTASEGVTEFVGKLAVEKKIDRAQMEQEFFQHARPTSLLQRFIEPDEVANLIVYVASEAGSATNGSALRVDGGVVRAIL